MTLTETTAPAHPRLSLTYQDRTLQFDLSAPRSLAIPLDFNGPQPNAFGLPQATAEIVAAGEFIGDVRMGGSVNCATVTLNPHGNGTHTECVGHITRARMHVHDCLSSSLMPAQIASVPLTKRELTDETYPIEGHHAEPLITCAALAEALPDASFEGCPALILRTLPNSSTKRRELYSGSKPPYLSIDAMLWVRSHNIQHLLVDIPSVDREEDEGLLVCHHLFWDCEGDQLPKDEAARLRTITEMIYVPDDIADGLYLLDLQIPAFCLDAAPSRPLIYPLLDG